MKKNKSLLKFFLIVLVSDLAGGLAGLGMIAGREMMTQAAQDLQLWLVRSYLPLQLGATLVCGGVALVTYRRAKPLSAPETEERDFERGEILLTRSMVALSVLMVLSFTLFGCYGAGLIWLTGEESLALVLSVLAFLGSMGLMIYGQTKQVQLTQMRNPEKRGNPLEFSFQKDWLASCDEAEQYKIYQASYHSFRATQMALLVSWVVAVLAGVVFGTGLLSVLLVGSILGVHTLTYLAAASRLQSSHRCQSKSRSEEPWQE